MTMARMSLYLVLSLFAGAILVNTIVQDPGYLLMAWGDWQVETSVWLALSALLLAYIVIGLLLRVVRSTLRVPKALHRWLGLRSVRGAHRRADKGFAAFFEGRWDVAEKALRKAGPADEQTLLHPLYAALAAARRGQTERALALLDQAETDAAAPLSLVVMARAECHLAAMAPDRAEQTLDQLSSAERALPRAKALQAEFAYAQRDWPRLIELLPDLRRGRVVPEHQAAAWEREAWLAALSETGDSTSTALSLWKRAPDSVKSEGQPFWAALVTRLQSEEDWEALQKALQERLEHYCESATLQTMSALPERQAIKMKKSIKRWCEQDAEGRCHAALARIAQLEGDTEAAGSLWEQAYGRCPSAENTAKWSEWLRDQGEEGQASALEAELLATLRQDR